MAILETSRYLAPRMDADVRQLNRAECVVERRRIAREYVRVLAGTVAIYAAVLALVVVLVGLVPWLLAGAFGPGVLKLYMYAAIGALIAWLWRLEGRRKRQPRRGPNRTELRRELQAELIACTRWIRTLDRLERGGEG